MYNCKITQSKGDMNKTAGVAQSNKAAKILF